MDGIEKWIIVYQYVTYGSDLSKFEEKIERRESSKLSKKAMS